MINFRYHVVSLTAVFLALAIGLVVGTAALNGPVADSLKNQIGALNKDNSNKRDQINQYREEINRNQDFATEVAPALLNGKLTGRKLLVVALPGTNEYADGVESMLKVGGKLVDAKGVSRLYRQNISGSSLLLLVLSAIAAMASAVAVSTVGKADLTVVSEWWDNFVFQLGHHF